MLIIVLGAIEKGANDGQSTYANDLIKALRSGVSTRSRANTSGSKVKKGRKRRGDSEALKSLPGSSPAQKKASNWGLLEPLRAAFGRILDICKPLLNANSVICILLFLLIVSWFRNSRARYASPTHINHHTPGLTKPQRIAAYEELWHAEEENLWDWLEERVGTPEGFVSPMLERRGKTDKSGHPLAAQGRSPKGKEGDKLGMLQNGRKSMEDREVEWAISVTEDKLKRLKQVVATGKPGQRSGGPTISSNDAEEEDGDDELSNEQLKHLERILKDEL